MKRQMQRFPLLETSLVSVSKKKLPPSREATPSLRYEHHKLFNLGCAGGVLQGRRIPDSRFLLEELAERPCQPCPPLF